MRRRGRAAAKADYEKAYLRAMVAKTLLDLMLQEYPEPPQMGGQEQALELNDLAQQLEALTEPWAAEQTGPWMGEQAEGGAINGGNEARS